MTKRALDHLYGFQEDGVSAIVNGLLRGCYVDENNVSRPGRAFLLYDEMGLGKTRQALETLKRLRDDGHLDGPSLIICPAQVVNVWAQGDRLELYSDDFEPVLKFQDPSRLTPRHIMILSYNMVQTAYRNYIQANVRDGRLSNQEMLKYCTIHNASVKRLSSLQGDSYRTELINIAKAIDSKYFDPTRVLKPGTNEFFRQRWGCIVMDEIHYIKNGSSATGKAVAFLNSCFRLGLTGTPVVNHGMDMVNILKYGLNLFDVRWKLIKEDPNCAYCSQVLTAFTLGRKKGEIDEIRPFLPKRDRTQEDIDVQWIHDGQRRLYVEVKEQVIRSLDQMNSLRKTRYEDQRDFSERRKAVNQTFWNKLSKMRQICLHPDLPLYMTDNPAVTHLVRPWIKELHGTFHPWIRRKIYTFLQCLYRLGLGGHSLLRSHLLRIYADQEQRMVQPSPKMMELLPYLDRKIVVFSTFRKFLECIMRPWLTSIGVRSALFCGNGKQEQQAALDTFEKDPSTQVLLIVKGAGGVGLNLQHAAHVCFIMDPHFNEAVDEQASGRVDRFGQQNEVIIRKLYMEGSVDLALKVMKEEKMSNVNGWLSNDTAQKPRSLQAQGLYLKKHDTVTWP